MVLDRLAAHRLWPHGDALGKHVLLSEDDGKPREMEVVGIVANVQEHVVGRGREPACLLPVRRGIPVGHAHPPQGGFRAGMLQRVRREIRAFDAALPVLSLKTMQQHLEGSADLWIMRTAATLFSIFGGVALLLATIGLYGIRSYTVARRTREIGIRMALGASPRDTLRLVVREGAVLTAIGASAGSGALVSGRKGAGQHVVSGERLRSGSFSGARACWAWFRWWPVTFLRDGQPAWIRWSLALRIAQYSLIAIFAQCALSAQTKPHKSWCISVCFYTPLRTGGLAVKSLHNQEM